MDYPSEENHYQATHAALLINSYQALLGKTLIPQADTDLDLARALFHAPIAVMSHDTAPDPIFNYANLKALQLFEMSWAEFTSLPSRFSVEQIKRAEREKLLATVKERGFVYPFQSIRTTKSGRSLQINDGAVWNLIDADRHYRGQAACFLAWEYL